MPLELERQRGEAQFVANLQWNSATWQIPLQVTIDFGVPALAPAVPAFLTADGELSSLGAERAAATDVITPVFSRDALASQAFGWSTALSLAMASSLSYRTHSQVAAAASAWQLQHPVLLEAAETQCFVATSPDVHLVAFRGTESVGDWLADLNARTMTVKYGKVHRGFYLAYQDIKDQLLENLSDRPKQPLVITGHSLGGALATLAAIDLNWQFSISSVYTFGQPRVGKGEFESQFDALNLRFFRFVNDDDIVPRVPPGYSHVGRLIHFDAGGAVDAFQESVAAGESSPVEAPALTEAQFDVLRAQLLAERARQRDSNEAAFGAGPQLEGFFPSFSDHKIDNYIQKIAMQSVS